MSPPVVYTWFYLSIQIISTLSFPFFDFDNFNIGNELNDGFRTINGEGNNIANPEWGKADTELVRCVPSQYSDGFNSLAGSTRPNARWISNYLSSQIPEDSSVFINNRFLTNHAVCTNTYINSKYSYSPYLNTNKNKTYTKYKHSANGSNSWIMISP